MHMAMVVFGGVVLFGLFLLFGNLWGGEKPDYSLPAKLFIPIWFIITLINMWVGVTKAGYSVKDELPILILVFALPALLAAFTIFRAVR